jgi:hypothetical protein
MDFLSYESDKIDVQYSNKGTKLCFFIITKWQALE